MTYQVVGLLGRGATAVVELAVAADGARVARKRLHLAGSGTGIDAARRRLRREAEILRRLDHPGIVPVLDVEDDGTDVVIVMPALEASLADRVAVEGPLPADEVVAAGRRLLGALAAAHRSGVVHRDIKPGNVLFDAAGAASLADFGVATSRDLTIGLTGTGNVVGTPGWIAPEQARGEVGPAADVFSLGATLLFACTGAGPYGSGPPGVLAMRAEEGRVAAIPAGVPLLLSAPLAAMLDPDPRTRPSAADMLGGFDGTETWAGAPSPARAGAPSVAGAGTPSVAGEGAPVAGAATRGAPAGRSGLSRVLLGGDGAPARGRWRAAMLASALVAVGGLVVAVAVAVTGGAGSAPASSAHRACAPLPYRACGAAPAPHTDGSRCLPGWYDLDGTAANGCEARSDYVAGRELGEAAPISANLVPPSSTDVFTTRVQGHFLSLCSGSLALHLTAPPLAADRLEVWHDGDMVASATSAGGQPAVATVDKPGCLGSYSETLTLKVTTVAGASGQDFTLTRSGGW